MLAVCRNVYHVQKQYNLQPGKLVDQAFRGHKSAVEQFHAECMNSCDWSWFSWKQGETKPLRIPLLLFDTSAWVFFFFFTIWLNTPHDLFSYSWITCSYMILRETFDNFGLKNYFLFRSIRGYLSFRCVFWSVTMVTENKVMFSRDFFKRTEYNLNKFSRTFYLCNRHNTEKR